MAANNSPKLRRHKHAFGKGLEEIQEEIEEYARELHWWLSENNERSGHQVVRKRKICIEMFEHFMAIKELLPEARALDFKVSVRPRHYGRLTIDANLYQMYKDEVDFVRDEEQKEWQRQREQEVNRMRGRPEEKEEDGDDIAMPDNEEATQEQKESGAERKEMEVEPTNEDEEQKGNEVATELTREEEDYMRRLRAGEANDGDFNWLFEEEGPRRDPENANERIPVSLPITAEELTMEQKSDVCLVCQFPFITEVTDGTRTNGILHNGKYYEASEPLTEISRCQHVYHASCIAGWEYGVIKRTQENLRNTYRGGANAELDCDLLTAASGKFPCIRCGAKVAKFENYQGFDIKWDIEGPHYYLLPSERIERALQIKPGDNTAPPQATIESTQLTIYLETCRRRKESGCKLYPQHLEALKRGYDGQPREVQQEITALIQYQQQYGRNPLAPRTNNGGNNERRSYREMIANTATIQRKQK